MDNGVIETCSGSGEVVGRGRFVHNLNNIEDIYYFWGNCICKTSSGEIYVCSASDYAHGQEFIPQINGLEQISDYSVGYGKSEEEFVFAALKTDGTVVAIGSNNRGQCDVAAWNPPTNLDTISSKAKSDSPHMLSFEPIEYVKLTIDPFSDDLSEYRTVPFSSAKASSFLQEGEISFAPENTINDKITRPWSEGVEGDGIGESLTLHFEKEQNIDALSLRLGYADRYEKNNRPRMMEFSFSDGSFTTYEFSDVNAVQRVILILN